MKTYPHGKDDRLLLSGTMLRKTLSEGGEAPVGFSRPEVVKVFQEYYSRLHREGGNQAARRRINKKNRLGERGAPSIEKGGVDRV
jgi:ATP sulfurylase